MHSLVDTDGAALLVASPTTTAASGATRQQQRLSPGRRRVAVAGLILFGTLISTLGKLGASLACAAEVQAIHATPAVLRWRAVVAIARACLLQTADSPVDFSSFSSSRLPAFPLPSTLHRAVSNNQPPSAIFSSPTSVYTNQIAAHAYMTRSLRDAGAGTGRHLQALSEALLTGAAHVCW